MFECGGNKLYPVDPPCCCIDTGIRAKHNHNVLCNNTYDPRGHPLFDYVCEPHMSRARGLTYYASVQLASALTSSRVLRCPWGLLGIFPDTVPLFALFQQRLRSYTECSHTCAIRK